MESTQLPLRDIHLPPAIGWWPPAIGWWVLAIVIPLLIWLSYLAYKRITKQTAIKTAKRMLLIIKDDKLLDNRQKLAEISKLIRRVAISTSKRDECAGLTGQAWLEFLDKSLKDRSFSTGIGQLLGDKLYSKVETDAYDIDQLISLCETWIGAQNKKQAKKKK